mgnify:CR=1 FL=1
MRDVLGKEFEDVAYLLCWRHLHRNITENFQRCHEYSEIFDIFCKLHFARDEEEFLKLKATLLETENEKVSSYYYQELSLEEHRWSHVARYEYEFMLS